MSSTFRVVEYDGSEAHRKGFEFVNESWISSYFELEPIDRELLGQPEKTILQPGGFIWLAVCDDEIVGSAALLLERDTASGPIFELGKMGVLEQYRGRGIGKALCKTAIEHARRRGAVQLYLLGNSSLVPAATMYASCGFTHRPVTEEERRLYKRVDFAAEIVFQQEREQS